jgi:hypothetical protein
MKKNKKLTPLFNIGDYVGTDLRSNQWGNEWFEDGSTIVKIEYGYVPYSSSSDYYPSKQFVYTLKSGKVVGEQGLRKLP